MNPFRYSLPVSFPTIHMLFVRFSRHALPNTVRQDTGCTIIVSKLPPWKISCGYFLSSLILLEDTVQARF